MKQLLLFVLAIPFLAFSQVTFTPEDTVIEQGIVGKSLDLKIYAKNTTGSVLTNVYWKLEEVSLPTNMSTFPICDPYACHFNKVEGDITQVEQIIADSTIDQIFKITLTPKAVGDSGQVRMVVFDNANLNDTLTFILKPAIEDTVVSVNELTIENEVSIFPNPASSQVTINTSEANSSLKVYGLLGDLMLTRNLTTGSNRININDFPNGLYYFSIESPKGKKVERIIKN